MMALLCMPHEYWMRYFTFDNLALLSSARKSPTPFSPELGDRSLLGPVRTPRNVPVTPFASASLKRDANKAYFPQPWK
jgi:hypothetical protein